MTGRMWVLATIAWAVVVAAGSALTWVAIDRAGQQVSGDPLSSTTQPGVVGTIGSAPSASGAPTGEPSHTPSAAPSTSGQPGATVSTPAPTRRPTGSKTSTAPLQTQTRTWSGTPGFVTASCTGSRLRITGFSPNEGWHTERSDDSGEDDAEIKFEKNETEVQVRATCVAGVPRFQVESGDDD